MKDKADKKAMATLADSSAQKGPRAGKTKAPDWAQGLRRLYDSVLEEPLPDNFARLLDELDKDDNG